MVHKSIGPLQDAQQAMKFIRQHAGEWNLDSSRIGAIGFSAGVPVEAHLFEKGDHGFFLIARDRWQGTIMEWLTSNGWLNLKRISVRPTLQRDGMKINKR